MRWPPSAAGCLGWPWSTTPPSTARTAGEPARPVRGRRQLVVYRFFFEPGVAGWPEGGCDGERVVRTYFVNSRGDEALGSVWSFLDITALGRQEEEWEDSPEGYPQTPPYEWWRRYDECGR